MVTFKVIIINVNILWQDFGRLYTTKIEIPIAKRSRSISWFG